MHEIAIELQGISKTFGSQCVLDNISMKIPKGLTTVVIGPSGTGKSVLLKHIVGLLKPDFGEIIVLGKSLYKLSENELVNIRKKFGMLFQDGALFGSLSVEENIAFPLKHHTTLSKSRIHDIVMEKLALVHLSGVEKKYPSELSGGMRKRVALARAIAMEPDIVLFDEPHSGLDPVMSDAIDDLIVEMKERLKMTFFVISHDIIGTFRIADFIGMLHKGKLIAYDTKESIRLSQNDVVKKFLSRNIAVL